MGLDFQALKTLDPNAVFTIAETARILGMSHNGLFVRIRKGKLKAGRNGARYFILGAEIQKQVTMPVEHDV